MAEAAKQKIPEIDIQEEMRESFMTFAMSVIVARALPDVRDGLKPAQRRILYAMHAMNLGPGARYSKCAGVVGETMKTYHPHGNEVIYPTLARMAQGWNLLYPLVDGHGNFGSVDGDPPGAMRYTEARLSPLGARMLVDIDKNTVDFVPNFDQSANEPTVLPSAFPNLLCNGGSGIAVGMATNIPPHNLTEVINACCLLIDNPDTTLEEVMKVLPGPDFPTGGLIMGTSGIKSAFSTGRGSIVMQARASIEPLGRGDRQSILITEIPYNVNKTQLVEQIAQLATSKRRPEIVGLRDESDRKGMRIVVELRRDANPNVVLNNLYKHTRLRTTFPVNAVALVDGVPRTLGILGLLNQYLSHRREIITRRSQFELEKARARAHILEGYRIALKFLDEVIAIIRAAANPAAARKKLIERFKLTEKQANAILELLLRQLTSLERKKIDDEYKEIIKRIAHLEDLLADVRKIMQVVKEELQQVKEKHGNERRTRIRLEDVEDLSIEDLIAEEEMVITATRDGYMKRLPMDTYRTQGRGGKGIIALTAKEEDQVEHLFITTTHHYVLFFTNRGRVYRLRAHEIPAASRQARGTAIINLIAIEPKEQITAILAVKEFAPDRYVFMTTSRGTVKKVALEGLHTRLKGGIIAIKLQKGDELCWVEITDGKQDIVLATKKGMSVRFSEEQVRPMGRQAAGVRGIRLRKSDEVVGMAVCREDAELLVATRLGFGKRTKLSNYRKQRRGGIGIKTLNITAKNGPLVGMAVVDSEDQLLAITTEGQIIRQRVGDIRETGRSAQGVRLIRLGGKDRLATIAVVIKKEVSKAVPEGEIQ
ncbi:MAG: DNA gyrase subunit A [Armatimonadetes bacterium]|nr:DNA gyrase subunit A [Armatimonadota bacterium]NIM24626.1 DNA gyrase subunit A [Armatimonadota bacterium]NIM68505.1 DNA gyrase subunit A [Armatimonadota bacterium]NIM76887.1 DNA gyrase subunit A [Armatimonadota bacterium]NIN06699.1 DNA gyrase subunit A [Armatimonadota bacterium]